MDFKWLALFSFVVHLWPKLNVILDDINEQDTSLLDCKHKHMMKSGAPADNFGVLYRLLPIEFHGFTSRINSSGYHSLVPGLI